MRLSSPSAPPRPGQTWGGGGTAGTEARRDGDGEEARRQGQRRGGEEPGGDWPVTVERQQVAAMSPLASFLFLSGRDLSGRDAHNAGWLSFLFFPFHEPFSAGGTSVVNTSNEKDKRRYRFGSVQGSSGNPQNQVSSRFSLCEGFGLCGGRKPITIWRVPFGGPISKTKNSKECAIL